MIQLTPMGLKAEGLIADRFNQVFSPKHLIPVVVNVRMSVSGKKSSSDESRRDAAMLVMIQSPNQGQGVYWEKDGFISCDDGLVPRKSKG